MTLFQMLSGRKHVKDLTTFFCRFCVFGIEKMNCSDDEDACVAISNLKLNGDCPESYVNGYLSYLMSCFSKALKCSSTHKRTAAVAA